VNPAERVIRRVDAAQQRHTPSAFVFGVIKKYGDDNGGTLASSLAHSALVSVFPLLLILSTVLGLVAAGDAALRERIKDAAANQVPMIGQQLTGNIGALHRSSLTGLIVGLAVLVWGATGLAQSGLFAMEQVWNLPGPARPGFFPRLGRCALFLAVLGVGVLLTTLLTSLDAFTGEGAGFVVLANAAALVANAVTYLAGFRVLTPKGVPIRSLVPGALAGAVVWTVLQYFGVLVIHHFVQSNSAYGTVFGTLLALVAWLYLAAQITVYAAEINVVLARRLWPRSILQPPLTQADRATLELEALQTQRRDEGQITWTFTDQPAAPAPAAPPTPAAEPDGSPPAGQR
jgi:YihY family inner membrane protein